MKDVVAVLGEWNSDGPIRIELAACGIKDAGLKKTADAGLKAIANALASCPHFWLFPRICGRSRGIRPFIPGASSLFRGNTDRGRLSLIG